MTTGIKEEAPPKPICFILARKYSKRLPGKSKLLINGKPLILHAIEAAKNSEVFERVIVSSDDMEVLEIAYDNNAMIHKRPYELCTDKVQQKQVMRFLLSVYGCDQFCMMTPCNPFVTSEDLKGGFALMQKQEAHYVISASRGKPEEYALQLGKDGFIEPKLNTRRTQVYKPTFYPDGGFVFAVSNVFLHEFDYGFYGSRCTFYETPHTSVDIDTEEDYLYARYLLEIL